MPPIGDSVWETIVYRAALKEAKFAFSLRGETVAPTGRHLREFKRFSVKKIERKVSSYLPQFHNYKF